MLNKEELDFHPEFVAPYYGGLMNMNFTQSEIIANPFAFLTAVKNLKSKLSPEDILMLLNHNWRPSKVGAWIIGLGKMFELEDALGAHLKSHAIYVEHVICSLCILDTPTAVNTIKNFLQNRIIEINQMENPYNAIDRLEKCSIDWAFAALKYLNKENGSQDFEQLINMDAWIELENMLKLLKKKERFSSKLYDELLNIPNRDLGFEKGMEMIARI